MYYREINIPNKEIFRAKIKELYGRDISNSICQFSSRNYIFTFKDTKPVFIRVSTNNNRTVSDIENELKWLDDLRKYIPEMTYAIPSENNSIAEIFSIDNNRYCATQFRLVYGETADAEDRDENYLYNTGKLLGKIHKVSRSEQEKGLNFKRCNWYEKKSFDFCNLEKYVSQDILSELYKKIEKVKSYPVTSNNFGMIHGDFQVNNILIDWDIAKVINFDGCCYGPYISDIATALLSFIINPTFDSLKVNRKDLFFEYLIHFKKGYETEYILPEEEWQKINEFVCVRLCECACMLSHINLKDLNWQLDVINRLIKTALAEDCLEAFNQQHRSKVLSM